MSANSVQFYAQTKLHYRVKLREFFCQHLRPSHFRSSHFRPPHFIYLCIVIWAILLNSVSVQAAAMRNLRFESLTIDPALASETVQCVVQDKHGFMWFGSDAALRRYDGYQITTYKAANSTPFKPGTSASTAAIQVDADTGNLQDSWIQALYAEPNGQLWIGTRNGLHTYNPTADNFTRYLPDDKNVRGKEHLHIMAIISDGKQGLWLATKNGLQHFDLPSKKFTTMRHDVQNINSLADNHTNALVLDARGDLWIGTASGLDRYRVAAKRFDHYQLANKPGDDMKRNSVQTLFIDKAQSLWIGTIGGLEAWRLGSGEPERRQFGPQDGLNLGWVTTLYQDTDSNLWVGNFDGLHLWDASTNRFQLFRHQTNEPMTVGYNRISAQFQDRSGTMWIGTWFAGVSHVDFASGGFSNFGKATPPLNGIHETAINSITSDKKNFIWMATNTSINRFDPQNNKVESYQFPPNKAIENLNQFNDFAIDKKNRAWVATAHGLYPFNLETHEFGARISFSPDPDANFIRQLYFDRDNFMWLATRGGLYRFDPDTGLHLVFLHDPKVEGSLSDNFVRTVLQDHLGNLWVGTFSGLDKLEPGAKKFIHLKHDAKSTASLSNDRITALIQDRRGLIWVGTGAGLNRLEFGADGATYFRRYRLLNKEQAISGILEGKDGQLWLSTDSGISRFEPATGRVNNYTMRDGLSEGSFMIGAGHIAADGTYYFGSELGGLTIFRPEHIRTNPNPPQVVITALRVNEQLLKAKQEVEGVELQEGLPFTKSISLPYHHAVFSIDYAALHYADPASNRYAYQLQGYENEWITEGAKQRRATYRNLAPGTYIFQIRAANKDGVWNETGTSLQIVVLQPIWRTWWFISFASGLLFLAIWSGYRSRMRAFTRQKHLLEEQVAIRTAEVIQQKQIVEQKNALVERQKDEAEVKNQLLEQQKYELERQKENVELAHHNISVLSEIGREITSTLDRDAIMRNVHSHIQGLLDATSFVIYLMDEDEKSMSLAFRAEYGTEFAPEKVTIANLESDCARCVREFRLIAIDLSCAEIGLDPNNTEQRLLCRLYSPLATGARMLGAMSISSCIEHAYGAREQLIFDTLCAYVAIALDNAAAYRQLEATLKTLRDTQTQLVQQEKMASLGTLTAGVAHEINNPANFAHVGAQALSNDLERFRQFLLDLAGEDAEAEILETLNTRVDSLSSQIGTIIEGTTRIKNLVLDLRTFSRLDQATKKTVPIGDSLTSTINLVRTQYAQIAEIRCELDANPLLECFPAELNQVFMNLIVNACQAIQSSRRKNDVKDKGLLSIRSYLEQEWLVIEFEDNGDGIPQAIIDHIFEPFFTTKTVGEGTGLGLSISFGIIEKHRGNISVRSTEGVGTCFTLRLPLAEQLES